MRRTIIAVIATCAALCAPAAALASGWTVVKKKSVSGQFAITAVNATISSPHKIAVDLVHGSGLVILACTKGFSVSSGSHRYGPGLHVLAKTAGKDSCDVTASISGSGNVTVEILKG